MNFFFFIFSEDLTSLQADSQEEQAWLACPILDSQQHDREFKGDRSLSLKIMKTKALGLH